MDGVRERFWDEVGLGSILRDAGCSEQKDQEGRDCVNRASVPLKPQALVELGER